MSVLRLHYSLEAGPRGHRTSKICSAKWVPSIYKAVLNACVLYAASCSGISLGGLKWFPCVQAC